MKKVCLALLTTLLFTFVCAQDSKVLTGNRIYKDACNESEYPVTAAFDNDVNTYFRSCPPFGNWIGLDLQEKHIITKIAYCPRVDSDDYHDRLQLGLFEGANQADFSDAIPLFIIPGLTKKEFSEQEIACTRGFRYVRFVFPYAQTEGKSSYLSELKFYGYPGEGDDSKLPQLTNLPTVSIKTVMNQDIVSKEYYTGGVITLIYAGGTKVYTDSIEIRGRGNNSWTHPKKPYRIKLKNSTNLMGLPAKARNWTLINNYGDKTLMRNILAFDFSRKLELPYTSPAEAVDVVLNGDYKGCYQLCDHIDVRKNRVDIEEMSDKDLTGGYAIEIDALADSEPKKFYSSLYNIPVTIKYPDEDDITIAQEEYIASHFENLTLAVTNASNGEAQSSFAKYMDLESFLRHFLVGEYSGNTDTYWSVRMYKKRNDDKFYFGPVWDFDLGFDNDWRTYPVNANANSSNQWVCLTNTGSAAGGTKNFVRKILANNEVQRKLADIYAHYRDNNIISTDILTGVVDSCAQWLDASQDLNFKRWQILYTKVHENPMIYGTYAAEVNNVRRYISGRIQWMDSKLNYSPVANEYAPETAPNVRTNENTIYLSTHEPVELSVFDLNGNTVRKEKINAGNHQISVNKGFYIVTLTDNKSKKYNYKCIVP